MGSKKTVPEALEGLESHFDRHRLYPDSKRGSSMLSHRAIEDFTRDILGCDCPPEVFENIDCQDKTSLGENDLRSFRINIGNRLLVYIVECLDMAVLVNTIRTLAAQGKKERDSQAFNRFRLVITSHEPDAINDEAQAVFQALSPDEKLHLHVIHEQDFPA